MLLIIDLAGSVNITFRLLYKEYLIYQLCKNLFKPFFFFALGMLITVVQIILPVFVLVPASEIIVLYTPIITRIKRYLNYMYE